MPNWVYNGLVITGELEKIAEVKAQLAQPHEEKHYDFTTETLKTSINNDALSFWNIIKPTDLDAYYDAKGNWSQESKDHWYNWNIRNWGVKWDASDVYFVEESEEPTSLCYTFSTPWGVPAEAISALSSQYPTLKFNLEYEEEQGWGGEIDFVDGASETLREYDNCCRDCDEMNTMEWCDECSNEICKLCKNTDEADQGTLKECEEHKHLAKETVNG